MAPILTAIYALPLAVIFLALSIRVILHRRAHRISVGDHGDKVLIKRMRAQSNFVEYAGFGLIMMLLAELNGASALGLHLVGLMLVLGRAAHAYGFGGTPQVMPLRVGGMLLTLSAIIVAGLLIWSRAIGIRA